MKKVGDFSKIEDLMSVIKINFDNLTIEFQLLDNQTSEKSEMIVKFDELWNVNDIEWIKVAAGLSLKKTSFGPVGLQIVQ